MTTENEKTKQVEELLEMSKTLYGMHEKIGGFEGATTTIRKNLLDACTGLDALRNQIIGGTNAPPPDN